jgi:MFS family permease
MALGDFLPLPTSSGWRILFPVGILPAVLVVPIVLFLREPEKWRAAKAQAAREVNTKHIGSPLDLFRHRRWRKNTLVGLGLGISGMVGLWGIGFFSPELVTSALQNSPLRESDLKTPAPLVLQLKEAAQPSVRHVRNRLSASVQSQLAQAAGPDAASAPLISAVVADFNRLIREDHLYDPEAFRDLSLKKTTLNLLKKVETSDLPSDRAFLNRQLLEQVFPGAISSIQSYIDRVRSKGLLLQDVGALVGMLAFTVVASWLNRRKAFLGAFALCLVTTAFVFYSLRSERDVYWMLPMMGFAQLAVFAGYSIYFPELYPTRLRGTGVGFCYNVVRFLTVPFNLLMGLLSTWLSFRTAAIIMSAVYLIGMIALLWAPETKDQPLPED